MSALSYSGYRFPPDIIQRAVWMYLRFTLSFREIEEFLAERGIVVTYESIRRWVLTFGPVIARRLRVQRPKPHGRWHLDEMAVRIGGKLMYLWRPVDAEGEVLDVLLQAKRATKAAAKLMRKLLKRQGTAPDEWVTDRNPAYGALSR
jgi:putative transposase